MIDRRLFIHFDWTLLGLVLILASIGILNLYSITAYWAVSGTPVYLKQTFWLLIGLVLMITIAFVEYRFYSDFAYLVCRLLLEKKKKKKNRHLIYMSCFATFVA